MGIPPSGPMGHLAFRIANRLIGNNENTSALEITLHGPKIRFYQSIFIAITSATMKITLDNKEISLWKNYEENQIETTISTEILQEMKDDENVQTIRADICGNV